MAEPLDATPLSADSEELKGRIAYLIVSRPPAQAIDAIWDLIDGIEVLPSALERLSAAADAKAPP